MPASTDPRELTRQDVSEDLQTSLRLYRRLYLARIDLDEARATVQELLTCRIPLPRSKPPSGLLMALTTALVVSYSRPFVNSRGQSAVADKTVPGSLLRTFTSKERELHDAIVGLRNKEVAHADAELLEISIKLYPDGDGAIFRNTRAPFQRRTLHAVEGMIDKLEQAFDTRCEELRQILPLYTWI